MIQWVGFHYLGHLITNTILFICLLNVYKFLCVQAQCTGQDNTFVLAGLTWHFKHHLTRTPVVNCHFFLCSDGTMLHLSYWSSSSWGWLCPPWIWICPNYVNFSIMNLFILIVKNWSPDFVLRLASTIKHSRHLKLSCVHIFLDNTLHLLRIFISS